MKNLAPEFSPMLVIWAQMGVVGKECRASQKRSQFFLPKPLASSFTLHLT